MKIITVFESITESPYITEEQHKELISKNEEIGKLLHHMLNNPEKY